MLDSLEYHEACTGNVEPAAPILSIIFVWAFNNGSLIDYMQNDKKIVDALAQFRNKKLSVYEFLMRVCGGELLENDFIDDASAFLSVYVGSGDYYEELMAVFSVNSIYDLPAEYDAFGDFLARIDVKYSVFNKSGKLYD